MSPNEQTREKHHSESLPQVAIGRAHVEPNAGWKCSLQLRVVFMVNIVEYVCYFWELCQSIQVCPTSLNSSTYRSLQSTLNGPSVYLYTNVGPTVWSCCSGQAENPSTATLIHGAEWWTSCSSSPRVAQVATQGGNDGRICKNPPACRRVLWMFLLQNLVVDVPNPSLPPHPTSRPSSFIFILALQPLHHHPSSSSAASLPLPCPPSSSSFFGIIPSPSCLSISPAGPRVLHLSTFSQCFSACSKQQRATTNSFCATQFYTTCL